MTLVARRMSRVGLLATASLAACAVAASTGGARTSSFAVTVTPSVSMTGATLAWTVPLTARALLRIGIGGEEPLVVPLVAKQMSATVAGLKPGTSYSYTLVVAGGAQTASGSFTTSAPARASFSVKGSAILADGQPFFPVVKWGFACAASVPSYAAFGMNVVAKTDYFRGGSPCPEDELYPTPYEPGTRYVYLPPKQVLFTSALPPLLAALAGKAWGVSLLGGPTVQAPEAIASAPALLGWCCSGDPSPSPAQPQAGRLLFGAGAHAPVLVYQTPLARGTFETCGFPPPGTSVATAYTLAHRAAGAHRPFLDLIALSTGRGAYTPGVITPARVQAQAWLSIAGGATGIGYLTDVTGGGGRGQPYIAPTDFGVAPEIAAAAQTLTRRLAELQPALVTPDVPTSKEDKGPVRVGARRYAGVTYVIAVNPARFASAGAFAIQGASGSTAHVLWEPRIVKVRNLRISDAFEPLAVHVYAIPP